MIITTSITFTPNYQYNQTSKDTIKQNPTEIHSHIVKTYTNNIAHINVIIRIAPNISTTKKNLPHSMRRTLASLYLKKNLYGLMSSNYISTQSFDPLVPYISPMSRQNSLATDSI